MENPMKLVFTEEQASQTRFPPSCPVLYYNDDEKTATLGLVVRVWIDLSLKSTRETMYTLLPVHSQQTEHPKRGRTDEIDVTEDQLQYAPDCPVWKDTSEVGCVLQSYHSPLNRNRLLYTVSVAGSETIHHGIVQSALSYRSNDETRALFEQTKGRALRGGSCRPVVVLDTPSHASEEQKQRGFSSLIENSSNRSSTNNDNKPLVKRRSPHDDDDDYNKKIRSAKRHKTKDGPVEIQPSPVPVKSLFEEDTDTEDSIEVVDVKLAPSTPNVDEVDRKMSNTRYQEWRLRIPAWVGNHALIRERVGRSLDQVRKNSEARIQEAEGGDLIIHISSPTNNILVSEKKLLENIILEKVGAPERGPLLVGFAAQTGVSIEDTDPTKPKRQRSSFNSQEYVWMSAMVLPHRSSRVLTGEVLRGVQTEFGCQGHVLMRSKGYEPIYFVEASAAEKVKQAIGYIQYLIAQEDDGIDDVDNKSALTKTEDVTTTADESSPKDENKFFRTLNLPCDWIENLSKIQELLQSRRELLMNNTGARVDITPGKDGVAITVGAPTWKPLTTALIDIERLAVEGCSNDKLRKRVAYQLSLGVTDPPRQPGDVVTTICSSQRVPRRWGCAISLTDQRVHVNKLVSFVIGRCGFYAKRVRERTRCSVDIFGKTDVANPYIYIGGNNKADVEDARDAMFERIDQYTKAHPPRQLT